MVKVFDLRQLRPLAPVPFSTGPAFLGAMPGAAPRVVVTSHEGLVNIVDVTDPASTEFYQVRPHPLITPGSVLSHATAARDAVRDIRRGVTDGRLPCLW
jgi:PAB-dependent poly(A)-specific ribonuclease subunit 2